MSRTESDARADPSVELRRRVAGLLREHHTATVATVGPAEGADAGLPHAASVFYAVDDRLRLVFLSNGSSRHAVHIKGGSPVAVTVAGKDSDWREIRGVQLWGRAAVLRGAARAGAMALYVARFPFVRALLTDTRMARQLAEIQVFRVTPERAALTDNSRGLFGRELLEHLGGEEACG